MKKRFLLPLLASLLSVGLMSGCGGTTDNANNNDDSSHKGSVPITTTEVTPSSSGSEITPSGSGTSSPTGGGGEATPSLTPSSSEPEPYPSIDSEEDGWRIVDEEPVAGRNYRLGLDRKDATNYPTIWWLTGQTQEEVQRNGKPYYLVSADDVSEGAEVEVILTNNGFKLKVGQRYLYLGENGTHINNLYKDVEADGSEFYFNAIAGAFGVVLNQEFYFSGAYGDFTTVQATKYSQYPDNYKVNLYEYVGETPSVSPSSSGEVTPSVTPSETPEPSIPSDPVIRLSAQYDVMFVKGSRRFSLTKRNISGDPSFQVTYFIGNAINAKVEISKESEGEYIVDTSKSETDDGFGFEIVAHIGDYSSNALKFCVVTDVTDSEYKYLFSKIYEGDIPGGFDYAGYHIEHLKLQNAFNYQYSDGLAMDLYIDMGGYFTARMTALDVKDNRVTYSISGIFKLVIKYYDAETCYLNIESYNGQEMPSNIRFYENGEEPIEPIEFNLLNDAYLDEEDGGLFVNKKYSFTFAPMQFHYGDYNEDEFSYSLIYRESEYFGHVTIGQSLENPKEWEVTLDNTLSGLTIVFDAKITFRGIASTHSFLFHVRGGSITPTPTPTIEVSMPDAFYNRSFAYYVENSGGFVIYILDDGDYYLASINKTGQIVNGENFQYDELSFTEVNDGHYVLKLEITVPVIDNLEMVEGVFYIHLVVNDYMSMVFFSRVENSSEEEATLMEELTFPSVEFEVPEELVGKTYVGYGDNYEFVYSIGFSDESMVFIMTSLEVGQIGVELENVNCLDLEGEITITAKVASENVSGLSKGEIFEFVKNDDGATLSIYANEEAEEARLVVELNEFIVPDQIPERFAGNTYKCTIGDEATTHYILISFYNDAVSVFEIILDDSGNHMAAYSCTDFEVYSGDGYDYVSGTITQTSSNGDSDYRILYEGAEISFLEYYYGEESFGFQFTVDDDTFDDIGIFEAQG